MPLRFTIRRLRRLTELNRTGYTASRTLPGNSPLFGALVLGTIMLMGGLSFLPALALGPIAEALRH
jgi:K+-transporting ATPase ATPase A chain